MLAGCTPWPETFARRYRTLGYWEGASIPAVLAAAAAQRPDRVALVDGDVRVTYAQLVERIERLAARFVRAGVKPLDRVVLQLPNVPAFLYAYFGLIRAGAIPVMALRAHRHTEVKHFITSAGAAGYVIPDRLREFDYCAMAEEMRGACPTLKQVFVAGTPLDGQMSLSEMLDAPMTPGDARATLAGVTLDPGEVALMLLSGGTTSLSKLIPRDRKSVV